jgi:hypothetical protein
VRTDSADYVPIDATALQRRLNSRACRTDAARCVDRNRRRFKMVRVDTQLVSAKVIDDLVDARWTASNAKRYAMRAVLRPASCLESAVSVRAPSEPHPTSVWGEIERRREESFDVLVGKDDLAVTDWFHAQGHPSRVDSMRVAISSSSR